MLNHLSIQCVDLAASTAFYDAVLETIGARRVLDFGTRIGYGVEFPSFWLGTLETGDGFRESHIAFTAPSREAVIAFRDAAVATGAEELHEPRVWPEYHPGYFGAFVRDPDGNNVEAVHHTLKHPEPAARSQPS
jgi:catechol 2,3-dioxygenase-like lactoylglutathione lyase family enzyme